ncbi:hypothetical protein QBC41DRAFT_339762 [Cercophora samala]|uniref:Uncharacterized protein n=1 Tax=Cercophora samala TaxID=330535 RepID=A0AA40D8E3_9PEZI|nr:hypothetical protein QBC41DRAFT_339762 [Cercophora samala]
MATFLLLWALVLACVSALPPDEYRYWISPECYDKDPLFDIYPKEVFYAARSAAERLADPTDTDFQNAFWALFKTDVNDPTQYNYSPDFEAIYGETKMAASVIVMENLNSLGNEWKSTTDRNQAHVRIHCDDMDRYEDIGDDPFRMWDPVDNRYVATPQGVQPCKLEHHNGITQAAANGAYFTIDICENVWIALGYLDRGLGSASGPAYAPRRIDKYQNFKATQEQLDLRHIHIGELSQAVHPVQILFHEWMHAFRYHMLDFPAPTGFTGGWPNAMAMTTQQAIQNADTYAFLGLLATLADLAPDFGARGATPVGGYAFDRSWALRRNNQKWMEFVADPSIDGGVWVNPVIAGKLEVYRDITGTRHTRDYSL